MFAATLKIEAVISNHVTIKNVETIHPAMNSRNPVGDLNIETETDAYYFHVDKNGVVSRWDFLGEAIWGRLDDGTFAATAAEAFTAEPSAWITYNDKGEPAMKF